PLPISKQVVYYPNEVTWEIKAKVAPAAKPGPAPVTLGDTQFQACNDQSCIPSRPRDVPAPMFTVLPGDPGAPPPPVAPPKAEVSPPPPAPAKPAEPPAADVVGRKPAKPLDDYKRDLNSVAEKLDHAGAVTVTGGP